MAEYQIAQKIRQILAENKNNMPEVPIHTFLKTWFHKTPYNELEFVRKMAEFADRYNFGYLTVLDKRKRGKAVRFWDKEKPKLLKEKGE